MTDATPKFCTGCGGALAEGARFCTGCGAAVAPAPAPAASGERPVAIIPNASLKKGFMGMKVTSYTLVLTESRIIFAEATAAMLKQSVADARDAAKADGKGFFGQWGAQMGAYSKLAQGYLSMDPALALAENPGNFAIEESAIASSKLKRGMTGDSDTNATPDRLIIKTTGGEKYTISLGSGLKQAKEALVAAGMI